MVDWTSRFQRIAEELASRQVALVVQGTNRRGEIDLFYGRPGAEIISSYLTALECTYQTVRVCDIDDLLMDTTRNRNIEDIVYVGGYARHLDVEALPGAIATLTARPVFPQSGADTISSEDKLVAKAIALHAGLRTLPSLSINELNTCESPIIVKPIVGGDSVGLQLYPNTKGLEWCTRTSFAEPYCEGFDLDVYTVRSPASGRHVVIGASGLHVVGEDNFIQDFQFKASATKRIGFSTPNKKTFSRSHFTLSLSFKSAIANMLEHYRTSTFSRIDFRVAAHAARNALIDLDDAHFLEVNTVPNLGGARVDWWDCLAPLFATLNVQPSELEPLDRAVDPSARAIVALILIWRLNERYNQSKQHDGIKL
jgi:hypothetical protein